MTEITGKMVIGRWLDIELRKDQLWVIISSLTWVRPNGQIIKIHPYLITDYATIPKSFWFILPKRSLYYDIAAAFHDDCMRYRHVRKMSIQECHNVFKEIMKFYKTPKWQYELMYSAVILAGLFIRTDGYGTTPWKLTKQEQDFYNQIKQQNLWVKNLNSFVNYEFDEFNIFG